MPRLLRFALFAALLLVATPVLADGDDAAAASDTPSESTWRRAGALFDRSPQKRTQMLSVFLGVPYHYVFYGFPIGVSGRYYIPIVHDGFISSLNDSFGIEFGADFTAAFGAFGFYPSLAVPVEAMWRFHLTPNFSAYAKAGVVVEFNFITAGCAGTLGCRGVVSASPIFNVGITYKLTANMHLRAEAGYPWIKVGLGFDM